MSHETDISFLDTPEILEIVFPVAYSPFYFPQPSGSSLTNAATHFVEVEAGVRIGCAMWAGGKEFPTILYFHGNGETVIGPEVFKRSPGMPPGGLDGEPAPGKGTH